MPTTHSNLGTHGEQWEGDTWNRRGRLAGDDDRKMPSKVRGIKGWPPRSSDDVPSSQGWMNRSTDW
jgi:hypothetical protein